MLKLILCLSLLGLVASFHWKEHKHHGEEEDEYGDLMEDLMDFLDDIVFIANRFRRSATPEIDDKCKRAPQKQNCCNDANAENMDRIHDLKRQCFQEVRSKDRSSRGGIVDPVDIFSCEKINKTKQDYICAMECVGHKENILDAAGNLLEPAKLIPFVKENFAAEPWQEPLVASFVDICLKEVEQKTSSSTEGTRCNPAPSHFLYCLVRQTMMVCPKDKQEQSKPCDRLRAKLPNNELLHDYDYS